MIFNGSFIHEKAAFSIFLLPSLQHTSRSQSNKMVIGISQELSKRSIKSCYVNFFLLRSIRIELSKINLFYLFFTLISWTTVWLHLWCYGSILTHVFNSMHSSYSYQIRLCSICLDCWTCIAIRSIFLGAKSSPTVTSGSGLTFREMSCTHLSHTSLMGASSSDSALVSLL